MRVFTTSIMIGSFILMGALPAAASQSSPVRRTTASVRFAAADASTDARETYIQKARGEILEWQRKLVSFNEKAEAKGKDATTAAEKELHKAWANAETASQELQTVGAEDWKSAKIAFESASHKLASAWDKVRIQDK
jgi:hypothetical protein